MTRPRQDDRSYLLLVFAVLVLATVLRLVSIEQRPFHHDEAINSILVERLWQRGDYAYNPEALHGPTLPYLTLPLLWASPSNRYAETTEATYRAVPVIFGLAVVMLIIGFGPGIGRVAALAAGVLCAISPAMIFYSRYYIHEMLLVAFSLLAIASGWQLLLRTGSGRSAWFWALLLGTALGLLHATKETFVIAGFAATLGLVAALGLRRPSPLLLRQTAVAAAAMMFVSVLFFSSFLTHASGPLDSLSAFTGYFRDGANPESVHRHPWWWYLQLMLYQDRGGVLFSPEAVILPLAVVGSIAAAFRWGIDPAGVGLARFFVVYAAVMAIVYSAIPYKTPWCVLGFLQAAIVLAGIGLSSLFRAARPYAARVALAAILAAGAAQTGYQNYLVNFRYAADERNPYVYAHALSDVHRVASTVAEIVAARPNAPRNSLVIYNWIDNASLYFYLRGIPGARFLLPHQIGDAPDAVDMLMIDEAHRSRLAPSFEAQYHAERFQLRPNIWGILYVRKPLWESRPGHS